MAYDATDENALLLTNACTDLRAVIRSDLYADRCANLYANNVSDGATQLFADASAVVSAYARTLCEPVLRPNGATVTFPDFRADISADVYAIARSDENDHFLANSGTHTVPDVTDENDLLFANACTDLRAVIRSDLYADRCANLHANSVSDTGAHGAADAYANGRADDRPNAATIFSSIVLAFDGANGAADANSDVLSDERTNPVTVSAADDNADCRTNAAAHGPSHTLTDANANGRADDRPNSASDDCTQRHAIVATKSRSHERPDTRADHFNGAEPPADACADAHSEFYGDADHESPSDAAADPGTVCDAHGASHPST